MQASLTSHVRVTSDLCQHEHHLTFQKKKKRLRGQSHPGNGIKHQDHTRAMALAEISLLKILLRWKRAPGSWQPLWFGPTAPERIQTQNAAEDGLSPGQAWSRWQHAMAHAWTGTAGMSEMDLAPCLHLPGGPQKGAAISLAILGSMRRYYLHCHGV